MGKALSGELSCPCDRSFHIPSLLESTCKGTNLLPKEQILPFMSRPPFGMVTNSKKTNKSLKLLPFAKMAEKHDSVSIHRETLFMNNKNLQRDLRLPKESKLHVQIVFMNRKESDLTVQQNQLFFCLHK